MGSQVHGYPAKVHLRSCVKNQTKSFFKKSPHRGLMMQVHRHIRLSEEKPEAERTPSTAWSYNTAAASCSLVLSGKLHGPVSEKVCREVSAVSS